MSKHNEWTTTEPVKYQVSPELGCHGALSHFHPTLCAFALSKTRARACFDAHLDAQSLALAAAAVQCRIWYIFAFAPLKIRT